MWCRTPTVSGTTGTATARLFCIRLSTSTAGITEIEQRWTLRARWGKQLGTSKPGEFEGHMSGKLGSWRVCVCQCPSKDDSTEHLQRFASSQRRHRIRHQPSDGRVDSMVATLKACMSTNPLGATLCLQHTSSPPLRTNLFPTSPFPAEGQHVTCRENSWTTLHSGASSEMFILAAARSQSTHPLRLIISTREASSPPALARRIPL